MKTFKSFFIIATAVLALSSCKIAVYGDTVQTDTQGGSGIITRQISLSDFSEIETDCSVSIFYSQQKDNSKAELRLSESIKDLANVYVKNNVLHIGLKEHENISYGKYEVTVSSSSLVRLRIKGSADVTIADKLDTGNFEVVNSGYINIAGKELTCDKLVFNVSGTCDSYFDTATCNSLQTKINGTGNIVINCLKTKDTNVEINGTGNVVLKGNTDEAAYKICGEGAVNAEELVAKRVTATVTGSGNIKCNATDYLSPHVTGEGTIQYKGDPKLDKSYHESVSKLK